MKKFVSHLQSDWYKYLLELIVITAGIVGAFSLNNWNEHRKEGLKKAQMLEALSHDFEKNEVLIEITTGYHTRALDGSTAAMMIITNDDQQISEDSLIATLLSTRQNYTFDAVNGALRSAISSGEIHFIENEELSDLLFQWEDFVDDINEDEILAREYAKSKIDFLNKYIRERSVQFSHDSDVGKSVHQSDIGSLYRDPIFEDYITRRYRSSDHILQGYNQLESMCQKILLLLKQEKED